ncbi:B3/B4 domain-containing protein [Bacillus tuaregi]|uniref:B3/B4 domain-containing protein n=1 Tax=Bacillus tuaregi TaxID=1816695 RepID=UPI0008F8D90C|nr:phenylalanine--tRNA ligase beta subunit-related protein [Bacillus tuaregi]
MELRIAAELTELIPGFKVGYIQYQDICVGESPQMLKGRLQLFQESIYFELEDKKVTDLPGILEWRQVFKKTGKDPNRYRHSAEALYRRVQKQNYLTSVHSAIDLNNFFSLQFQSPIGIYDRDQLAGSILIRLGQANEEYLGLNGRMNSLDRLIVSCDHESAFGSPFVDSERTAVTEATKNAIQIIYLKPSLEKDQSEKLTASLANMFTQIHGGIASWEIIE